MLQVSAVFTVTVAIPFAIRFLHRSVSAEVFCVGRIIGLVHSITNPFIYSTINKTFIRFLFWFKCNCFSRHCAAVSPIADEAAAHINSIPQEAAANGHDLPVRLETVKDEHNKLQCEIQSYNNSWSDTISIDEEHAPSCNARFSHLQGQDLTISDF